jgi:hypothetical protein
MNLFLNLLVIDQKRFTNLTLTRFLSGKNKQNNNGNSYCALTQEVVDSVYFIREKGETEGVVYTTRVIHYLTKNELCDEEKVAVDLPSNHTTYEMYELYCFNRGWISKSNNKGRYPNLVDYKRCKVDDMFWQEYMESLMFFLGVHSGAFRRSIAPTSVFRAHLMSHAANTQYSEIIFAIDLQRW